MIGCDHLEKVSARIEDLAHHATTLCGCHDHRTPQPISMTRAPTIVATDPGDIVKLDKAGYVVIVPVADRGVITVEHYAYDNTLMRVIEGANARDIYLMMIRNGWVTEMSHAAYLGKELTKAELSLQYGFKYVQDGA
jgi:tetrahydromethanopterin S-methyltransferase subunit A